MGEINMKIFKSIIPLLFFIISAKTYAADITDFKFTTPLTNGKVALEEQKVKSFSFQVFVTVAYDNTGKIIPFKIDLALKIGAGPAGPVYVTPVFTITQKDIKPGNVSQWISINTSITGDMKYQNQKLALFFNAYPYPGAPEVYLDKLFDVTVTPKPQTPPTQPPPPVVYPYTTVIGVGSLCIGASGDFSAEEKNGTADKYVWTVPNGFSINGGGTTFTDNKAKSTVTITNVNVFSTVANITVQAHAGAGPLSPAVSVPLNAGYLQAPPRMYISDGQTSTGTTSINVQRLSEYVLTVDVVDGATSYYWNIGNNATLLSGQGTNEVHVQISSFVGRNISFAVQPVNDCGRGGGLAVGGTITGSGDVPID